MGAKPEPGTARRAVRGSILLKAHLRLASLHAKRTMLNASSVQLHWLNSKIPIRKKAANSREKQQKLRRTPAPLEKAGGENRQNSRFSKLDAGTARRQCRSLFPTVAVCKPVSADTIHGTIRAFFYPTIPSVITFLSCDYDNAGRSLL